MPYWFNSVRPHFDEVFNSVSGLDVDQNDLLSPPSKHLPAEFQGPGVGYVNAEFNEAAAQVKVEQDEKRTAMSVNPLSEVKGVLSSRDITCVKLLCYSEFDCILWGFCR